MISFYTDSGKFIDSIEDGMFSCNKGHVITNPQSLHKVDKEMLDERKITQADLDKYNAHI